MKCPPEGRDHRPPGGSCRTSPVTGARSPSAPAASWRPPRFSSRRPGCCATPSTTCTWASRAGNCAYYAIVLFLISAAGGIFRFPMRRVIIGVSREMEYDLRNDFFAHLERMPPAYFRRSRTGDLMSRATNDLNAVRMMAGPSVMYAAQTLLVFVVAIILMLSIDARLTLIGAAAAAAGVDLGEAVRQRHPPPLRAHPGAARGDERRGPGEPVGRARGPRLRTGIRGAREIPPRPTRSTSRGTAG